MEVQGQRDGGAQPEGAQPPGAAQGAPGSGGAQPAGAAQGAPTYDLFIVHAAEDAEFVHGYLLPALNLPAARVLLVELLTPGAPIVDEIDRGVAHSRFTLAVLSPAYLADRWAVFTERLAASLDAEDARLIPLRLVDCPLPLHLRARVALDFIDRARWDAGAARLRAALHTDPPADAPIACPYPGMRPFTASDAGQFFGRQHELDELIGRLDRGEREIYVIGPSGSGKSSLVQAGVLHTLDAGSSARLGRSFAVRSMRPGERPVDRLAKLLGGDVATTSPAVPTTSPVVPTTSSVVPAVAPAGPGTQPGALPGALIDAVVTQQPPAERVLVFVDQLEELFTLADAAERQRFVGALRALRAEPRCHLLFALRADFYGALMDSPLWADLAGRISRVDVAPLHGAALAQAISEPAARVGVYLEPRLCDRLVADAADEPGALPHVQETLRLLWERRRQRLIGVAEYEALGAGGAGGAARNGLGAAIAQHADTAMRELAPAQQAIARRVLLRLVSFGEGRADTRRQQPVHALASAADTPADLAPVLQHLVDHRLVTVDDAGRPEEAVADLSHEALITAWPALATWIAARRADELRRRRLEQKVADWIDHGRGETGLLDRVELSEATQWMQGEGGRELGSAAELAAMVAASQRALDHQERERRRTARRIIAALAAFSVVASVLGLVVWRQRVAAQRRADDQVAALGRSYLDQGRTLLFDGQPMRALPYLVAARAHTVDDPMLGILFAQAASALPRVTLIGHASRVGAVAFSPDGRRAVTGSLDHTARIWDAATGDPLTPPLVHQNTVLEAAFSPDGTRVVTASADGTARVWNASTGARVTPPLTSLPSSDSLPSAMWHAAFSPDGTRVVTASTDRTAQIWDAATGARVTPPLRHGHIVAMAAFSPDGTRVVTASWDRTARIWDAATGAERLQVRTGYNATSAAFSPDGRQFVTAGGSDEAQIWDAATGEELTTLLPPHHWDTVRTAAFRPDGRQLITASDDHTVRFWDARTGQDSGHPLQLPAGVELAAFSADGKRVVTLSDDRTVRIWDEATRRPVTAMEHARDVNDAALSPDGSHVITASNDGTARIWDASPPPAVPYMDLRGAADAAAFSPDGVRVVTGGPGAMAQVWSASTGLPLAPALVHPGPVRVAALGRDATRVLTITDDGAAQVWDAWTGLPVTPPLRHHPGGDRIEARIQTAMFSPEGARLLTIGGDAVARLWDAATGAPIAAPIAHEFTVEAAAFSPDGRRLITASWDTVRVWDAATGALVATPLEHGGRIKAFSADRERAITIDGSTARIFDTRTWARLGGPLEHENDVYVAAFSPDRRYAITGGADHTAKLWDAATAAQVTPPLEHAAAVLLAAFSSDGARVVTGDAQNTVRIWEVSTGKLIAPPFAHPDKLDAVGFSPDGTRVITSDLARTRIWTVVVDPGTLDHWRAVARCSPFVLAGNVLAANLEPLARCPRP